ncbi:MAG: PEP-CTERM sorting domain-containing protein [Myxococcota bacterium]
MNRMLLLLTLSLLLALPAAAGLTIDPSKSTLTPSSGPVETLSGTLGVVLGSPLPLSSTTTFDVTGLAATSSGGLNIVLDPSIATPAAGVLNPSGGFLIPNLFLELDDGLSVFQLTVPNVVGSYGALVDCPVLCLETTFDIDTGGAAGIVTVDLFAVPEPSTAGLVLVGCLGLGLRRRAVARGRSAR